MAFKPAILLGLLCAALAANFSPSLLKGYRPGQHYVYDFDGQIGSSLSNGEDYSTIRIRSQVEIDILDNNNVIVDLQRPEIAQLHGFLNQPERLHNFQKFEQVEMRPEHVKQLDLPFQIKYENGKVSNIKFHQDDTAWSENIKRSIVNLLQVQLEAITEEDQEYPSSIVFKTNETTIEGECESVYHLQQAGVSRYDDETPKSSINITKTINYDKCQRRPELRYNYYRASEPVAWNSQQARQQANDIDSVVDIMTQYEFNLDNGCVFAARVLSKYSYDLVDKDHVSLATITVGQIVMKNLEKRSPPESDFPKKPAQDLMFSTELDVLREQFIANGNEEYHRQNPYLRLENAADVIKNIMRRLVKSSIEKQGAEGVEEDAVRQFSHLVTMLRLASKKNIEEIHDQLFMAQDFSEQTQQFIKEILADALATAGTKNTIDHLVEKIHAEEISPSKAARTLEKLYKLRLTSDKMNQQVKKLCDSAVAQKNENLKRSCYLAWGAMINAMCGHDHEHEHDHEKWASSMDKDEKVCPKSLKQQYVKDVMVFYKRASSKSDKILALKTLGNMGIDESVKALEKIITDKSGDRIIRIHAIDALRNLRDQVPQKLQRLLVPIFRDRREHPEIRMNTFQLLLQTRMDSALLHLLCSDMAHETNVDVKSFVYSTIQRWAENADNTLDQETQQSIKSCLVLLEQIDQSIVRQSASKHHQTGYFTEPSNWQELGGLLNFVSLFSNDSYLPKEVMASLDMLVDGRMIPNAFQFGVHMQELEQLASKIANNIGEKTFDDVVIRGRRSALSQYNPIDLMKNLFRKMELVARRNWNDAEPMFLVYRRHNNLDYSFFLIDENTLPQILKKFILEGKLDVSSLENTNEIIRTNAGMFNFESHMKLPTVMGIPMVINSRMITLAFVDGKYTIGFGKTEKVRDANIEIDIQPQMATSVIVKMEMFSPLFTSGVKAIHSMQGRLPINMQVEVKSPNVVPTFSWKLPQQETRLIHLQSRPVTFIRTWPEKSNVFIEPKEKTLLVPELERLHSTKDFESENPLTGMNFIVESHGYRLPWSQVDWLLSGENAFVLKISPTSRSAKAVRLSGEYSATRDAVTANQKLENIFEQRAELFHEQADQEIEALRQYIKRSSSKLVDFQRLVLRVESLQGSERNSIVMDLKAACNEHANMCMFEKNVKADFGSEWNWKTIGQVARPELNGIYGSVKSRHVVAKLESNWGQGRAQDKNTIALNFYGKPSQERVQNFKSLLNKNIDSQDNYDRETMLDEKFEQIPTNLKVNEVVMSIEHQVSEKTIQTILPVYTWLKTCPKANIYIPDEIKVDTRMAQKHSTLMARLTYDNALNVTLTSPEEQVEMLHWETEPKMSRKSKTIVDLFANSHDDYAKCTYKREEVETFDGQTIDIPLTSCYTLLAKDCGNSESPNFAVLAKRLNKRNNDLKVKFITHKNEYQLYKDPKDGQMSILVDNNIVIEADYDKYNIRKIESNDMTFYEVRCPHTKTILRFDGQKIIFKIAPMYMNRQCGVCGHLNNDREDDLLKGDNTPAKSIKDFHLSYLERNGDECEPAEVREFEKMEPKSSRRQQNGLDSDERQTKKPIKKTLAIETRQDICFSLKPVKSCPLGFETSEEDKKTEVEFKCYDRTSPIAMRYLREVRQDSTIDFDNEEISADYNKLVEIPRLCVKY